MNGQSHPASSIIISIVTIVVDFNQGNCDIQDRALHVPLDKDSWVNLTKWCPELSSKHWLQDCPVLDAVDINRFACEETRTD